MTGNHSYTDFEITIQISVLDYVSLSVAIIMVSTQREGTSKIYHACVYAKVYTVYTHSAHCIIEYESIMLK